MDWQHRQQLGVQAIAVGVAIAYAGILTFIIIFVIDKIMGIRSTDKDEMAGLDYSQHGEHGYGMLNAN